MRKSVIAGVVFFTLLTQNSPIFGSELMTTADAFEAGSWQLSVYGQYAEKEPTIDVKGVDTIQIPISGGGSQTIFARANAEIEMESQQETTVAALTVRPHNGLHYRIKVGQIRNYELEYTSGPVTNSFRSQSDGLMWGAGARWNATQATIVSAAMSIDFSYTQSIINLDRFQSGTTVTATKQRIEQDEFQVAVNVSRRWKRIEPFGGLKLMRTITRLKDRVNKQRVRGEKDGVSPFVGLALNIFDRETLIVEASFVDEEIVSAGLNIRF